VRILKELEGDFSEVRILKDLLSLEETIVGIRARVGVRIRIGVGAGNFFGFGGGRRFEDVGDEVVPGMAAASHIEFTFERGKALQEKLADVGQCGGRTNRDAIACDGAKESAEGGIDIVVGIKAAAPGGEHGGNLFAFNELELFAGVEGAEGGMWRPAKHAAAASIGIGEVAASRAKGERSLNSPASGGLGTHPAKLAGCRRVDILFRMLGYLVGDIGLIGIHGGSWRKDEVAK
jgi:hypothetical protein